jgi:tight adherence protein C
MELLIITTLLFTSVGLLAYQFSAKKLVGEVHLPVEIKGGSGRGVFDFREFLTASAVFTDRLTQKANMPIGQLKRKLISAGRPINVSQFLAFRILLMIALPLVMFIMFRPEPALLLIALGFGYIFPDLWLSKKIKQRHLIILKDLPLIIDLLNICVGAGLDFMVAVTRVIEEFRSCPLVDEFKIVAHEIQMGSSRRDSLKNLATRINSPEISSFVRTLLQADRMGAPIGEILKIQAEEVRFRRFQKGEESALKAPIKLLLPLLVFILPVVLIIVAGPILIQFTRGGFMKF